MKRFTFAIVLLLAVAVLAACGCDHVYEEVICGLMRCSLCENEVTIAANHSWKDAACDSPKTCILCGTVQGEALGHDWDGTGCLEDRRCLRCKAVVEATGHQLVSEILAEARPGVQGVRAHTCSVCGLQEQEEYSLDSCIQGGQFVHSPKEYTDFLCETIQKRFSWYDADGALRFEEVQTKDGHYEWCVYDGNFPILSVTFLRNGENVSSAEKDTRGIDTIQLLSPRRYENSALLTATYRAIRYAMYCCEPNSQNDYGTLITGLEDALIENLNGNPAINSASAQSGGICFDVSIGYESSEIYYLTFSLTPDGG